VDFAQDIVVGTLRREDHQTSSEWATKALETDADLSALRNVASKGEKLYQRTRNSASSESAKRSKQLVSSPGWAELHPLFSNEEDDMEVQREKMLARVGNFRPQESIFEIGARRGGRKNNEEAVDAIRQIRSSLEHRKQKAADAAQAPSTFGGDGSSTKAAAESHGDSEDENDDDASQADTMSEASSTELEVTFSEPYAKKAKSNSKSSTKYYVDSESTDFRDPSNYMSYLPTTQDLTSDRAYGVHTGSNTSNFIESARSATMDLGADESSKTFGENRQVMRWDKRHKKYVRRENDDDGSKGRKLVRGESGAKIAASFRSGRFERWMKSNRVGRMGRVGEEEKNVDGIGPGGGGGAGMRGKRFQHKTLRTPKTPDKLRGDYEKQVLKAKGAKDRADQNPGMGTVTAAVGKGKAKGKGGKGELRSIDTMVKERRLKEKRREKNARPRRRRV
jgi:ATP-dependent RNA helicase DDX54/DBP10